MTMTTQKHLDKGENHLVHVDYFTAYSPDVALSDYHLFNLMKERFRATH